MFPPACFIPFAARQPGGDEGIWDDARVEADPIIEKGVPMSPSQALWKKVTGPSAGLVQQHYVQGRMEALYRRNKDLERLVAEKLINHNLLVGQKLTGDRWLKVYEAINRRMQAASLTINFSAKSWFATENTYAGYTQLYERTARHGGVAQLQSNAQNPARMRADIDDAVTFKNLAGASPSRGPQRGLAPGRQGMDRVRAQMAFGAKDELRTAAGKPGETLEFAESGNRQFNPKTKQIFAGLNYGRRPHGSNYDYGTSHLVLSPKFKVNALYYPGDTFMQEDASKQVAFHIVGALVAWAPPNLLRDIIASCYLGQSLPDAKHADLLVEGHIFDELTFAGNITEMVLDAPYGSVYHQNAKKFATKHGIKLVLVGPVT